MLSPAEESRGNLRKRGKAEEFMGKRRKERETRGKQEKEGESKGKAGESRGRK
jgi:hypothetical protein